MSAVRTLREHFKETPIFARALDSLHAAELRTAGASDIITANTEVATEMGSQLLQSLGANANGVSAVCLLPGRWWSLLLTGMKCCRAPWPACSCNDYNKNVEDTLIVLRCILGNTSALCWFAQELAVLSQELVMCRE